MICTVPSREEAVQLLSWGSDQNPGPWTEHCKVAARVAAAIAKECGLDEDRAYVSGLLHDIGYYSYRNGKGQTCHIYMGYELMMEKGYESIARICLSHSFPIKDIRAYGGSDLNLTADQVSMVTSFLADVEYDDYDKLTQLCDTIGSAQGVVIAEKRMLDVIMRNGFKDLTIEKCRSYLALKDYFDNRCGRNIYSLFHDEMTADIFGC